MKKFITLTLSFLLLFSLVGCGNRSNNNNNNAQAPANEPDDNAVEIINEPVDAVEAIDDSSETSYYDDESEEENKEVNN